MVCDISLRNAHRMIEESIGGMASYQRVCKWNSDHTWLDLYDSATQELNEEIRQASLGERDPCGYSAFLNGYEMLSRPIPQSCYEPSVWPKLLEAKKEASRWRELGNKYRSMIEMSFYALSRCRDVAMHGGSSLNANICVDLAEYLSRFPLRSPTSSYNASSEDMIPIENLYEDNQLNDLLATVADFNLRLMFGDTVSYFSDIMHYATSTFLFD